ncbi:hypothetical protein MMC25_004538 [Agyrium rufum]|nr:hypothetical protein [Agyrium rufum]
MASPTTSPSKVTALIVRKHRSPTKSYVTKEILQGETVSGKEPQCPYPAESYGKEHVLKSFEWAVFNLRHKSRKFSPVGLAMLQNYKEACHNYLDWSGRQILTTAKLADREEGELVEVDEQDAVEIADSYIGLIRTYEEAAVHRYCMRETNSTSAEDMLHKLMALLQTSFYVRYGDMMAKACTILKVEAEKRKVPGFEAITKQYYTTLQNQIEIETPAWEKAKRKEASVDECPLHELIRKTCMTLPWDFDDMLMNIKMYARRNDLVHNDFLAILQKDDPTFVAKKLYDDRLHLPQIVPPSEAEYLGHMDSLFSTLTSKWFTTTGYEDRPAWWKPTPLLKQLMNDINKGTPEEREQVWKVASNSMQTAHAKELRMKQNAENLSRDFDRGLSDASLSYTPLPKRVASRELEAEKERCVEGEKRFRSISKLMSTTNRQREEYVSENRLDSFRPLPEPFHDPRLDSD